MLTVGHARAHVCVLQHVAACLGRLTVLIARVCNYTHLPLCSRSCEIDVQQVDQANTQKAFECSSPEVSRTSNLFSRKISKCIPEMLH